MPKIVVNAFLTLDGVMQAPGAPDEDRDGGFAHGGWQAPYADDVMGRLVTEGIADADGFLLGRKTYDIFASYWPQVTDPDNPIGAPRFFYTQVELDIDGFLLEYGENPFMQPPIRNLHPSILEDAIRELRSLPAKSNKGLSLHSNLDSISYRMITRGFMFAGRGESSFYPMPEPAAIEKANLKFWRSM